MEQGLFDTHAHLDDHAFQEDREMIIGQLQKKGVSLVLNPGCSIESSKNAVELANRFDFVYAGVGCHPDAADEINDDTLEELRQLCNNRKVKAIGEIGLDYHYEDIPRELQKVAFVKQMELASELELPVIVHERDAHEDGMTIVKQYPTVKGVFHCYSGSYEMARQLVDMGWYIGFTGVITFKNAKKAVEVASRIPRDRIVIETDCPYMAPEPFRGRRNDPGYIYRMAEKLSEIWGVSPEEAKSITMENGKNLYHL